MNPVTARANPGSLIELDQCPSCGGIWCDRWELFPVQPGEAERLETLDHELLRSRRPARRENLYCPRCTAPLASPADPLLGPDLRLRRCLRCDGIWLKRGQLSRYKRWQEKIREKKLPRDVDLKRLGRLADDPNAWVVTGTGGMFAYPRGRETEVAMSGLLREVLEALVRLIFQ